MGLIGELKFMFFDDNFFLLPIFGFIGIVLLWLVINNPKHRKSWMISYCVVGVINSFAVVKLLEIHFEYVAEYVIMISTTLLYPIQFLALFVFIIVSAIMYVMFIKVG